MIIQYLRAFTVVFYLQLINPYITALVTWTVLEAVFLPFCLKSEAKAILFKLSHIYNKNVFKLLNIWQLIILM